MTAHSLPPRPSLIHLKKQAKELLHAHQAGNYDVCDTMRCLNRFSSAADDEILSAQLKLADAQHALAKSYGFRGWAELKVRVRELEQQQTVSSEDTEHDGTPADKEASFRELAGDLYDSSEPPIGLDDAQRDLVLSVCPDGSRVVRIESFVPGWDRYPISITVQPPTGDKLLFSLQMTPGPRGCEAEAAVLPVLADAGLPVPEVLAGPAQHPHDASTMLLTTRSPGRPLPFVNASAAELDRTCELLLEAVRMMHDAAERVRADATAVAILPAQTLHAELDDIAKRGRGWCEQAVFTNAIQRLRPILARIDTPLVFTNGNVNTWHCLCEDGRLTGLYNFRQSCFEDPLIGFAKFRLWENDRGWAPFKRVGIVERYLYSRNMTHSDFAPRVALRCLRELQQAEVPVAGEPSEYRDRLLGLLGQSLRSLG
jgi:hypothetical protein